MSFKTIDVEIDADDVLGQLDYEYVLEYFDMDFEGTLSDRIEEHMEALHEVEIEELAEDCSFYQDMKKEIEELQEKLEVLEEENFGDKNG